MNMILTCAKKGLKGDEKASLFVLFHQQKIKDY